MLRLPLSQQMTSPRDKISVPQGIEYRGYPIYIHYELYIGVTRYSYKKKSTKSCIRAFDYQFDL